MGKHNPVPGARSLSIRLYLNENNSLTFDAGLSQRLKVGGGSILTGMQYYAWIVFEPSV